jgi:predicted peptidase
VTPQFLHFYQKHTKSLNLNFLLFGPENYQNKEGRWPLILFLHGAGERGKQLEKLLEHSIPDILAQSNSQPFFLMAPQCPKDSFWILHKDSLLMLLEELCEGYPIDRSRIYLTGVSMGAELSWLLAKQNPRLFAAFVPICGRGPWWADFPKVAGELNQLPIWAFHGDQDSIIPVSSSRDLVQSVKDAGGDIRYTEYPGVDHDAWTQAYKDQELYKWLFAQRKS